MGDDGQRPTVLVCKCPKKNGGELDKGLLKVKRKVESAGLRSLIHEGP